MMILAYRLKGYVKKISQTCNRRAEQVLLISRHSVKVKKYLLFLVTLYFSMKALTTKQ